MEVDPDIPLDLSQQPLNLSQQPPGPSAPIDAPSRDVAADASRSSPGTSPFPFTQQSPPGLSPPSKHQRYKMARSIDLPCSDDDEKDFLLKRYFRKQSRTAPLEHTVTLEVCKMSDLAREPLSSSAVSPAFKIYNAIETVLEPGETKLLNTHIRIATPRGYFATIVGVPEVAVEKGVHAVTTPLDSNFR